MDDSISRKSAIDVVHSAVIDFFDCVEDDSESPITHHDEQLLSLNKAITTKIKALPSVERKTGKWVKVGGYATPGGDPVWYCSECGKGLHVYGIEHGTYGKDVSDGQWVACPNCGARMEQDDEV